MVTSRKWSGPEDDTENIYITNIVCKSLTRAIAIRANDVASIHHVYINGVIFEQGYNAMPVSYTHLDVYKRQGNGYIELTPQKSDDPNIWMTFSATFNPEAYTEYGAEPVEVELCDYASAGNTMKAYPFFKVWLPQLFDPRD